MYQTPRLKLTINDRCIETWRISADIDSLLEFLILVTNKK